MNKKDWIIIIETITILFLLIHSIIYTVMSQDLIDQIKEGVICDEFRNNDFYYN